MMNQRKFDYIIKEMVVMGETGHMKNLPFLKVNLFARDIIREEGITPGELTDRIKQGLLDAGVKDKFDEKTVEQLMGNAESLRNIKDYTRRQEPGGMTVDENEEEQQHTRHRGIHL